MNTLTRQIRKFKKTKGYKYYKKYMDRQIALGHNEMGISFEEHRYSIL